MSRNLYAYSGFGADAQGTVQCPSNRILDPNTGLCVRRKANINQPRAAVSNNTMTYVAIGGVALVAAYLVLR
jgi:hypothetical protein